jgi:hypothetical protein
VKKLLGLGVLCVAAIVLSAQTLSSKRLERIDQFFQEQVDQERIAGAVALVLQDGKPVYEKAFGWADKEAKRKMTTGAIFRIASQSKALTSAVILSLMEEGKLAVTDPAGRYIPTFAKTTVLTPGVADLSSTSRRGARSRSRICSPTRPASRTAKNRGSRPPTRRRTSAPSPAAGGTPPTRTSRSATRWNGSARCPSSRSPARPMSTGTTPTSSAASPRKRRACRSTN